MKRLMIIVFLCISLWLIYDKTSAEQALEPYTYSEDFETGELNAWDSYPLWQDTAFDPWLRPSKIVPGDNNISLEQTVNAFWTEDTYTGMQKRLRMFLVPGSTVSFRFYVKSNQRAEYVALRFASGKDRMLECRIPSPQSNQWIDAIVTYTDIIIQNPRLENKTQITLNALAVLVKITDADSSMKHFFSIDDVVVKGAHSIPFRFMEPAVYRLSEWKPCIPKIHYRKGDTFKLRGQWPIDADDVTYSMMLFTDRDTRIRSGKLSGRNGTWTAPPFRLDIDPGMYLISLEARKNGTIVADEECTLFIGPENIGGKHPRLWFDDDKKQRIKERLLSDRFKSVADDIRERAASSRKALPVEDVVFIFDQLNPEYYLEGQLYQAWFGHLSKWDTSVYYNALAYAFFDDRAAGEYTKAVMLRTCRFPYWVHPWVFRMGWHSYYAVSETGKWHALGYDMIYDLMTEDERRIVRQGLLKNVIIPNHLGYVEDNRIVSNTSNWIAMLAGGSLIAQAAIWEDGMESEELEPYFTGAMLKFADMIQKSVDPTGAYGEGGYFGVTFGRWNESFPVLENVFNMNFAEQVRGVYDHPIWAGFVKEKKVFQTGDSGGFGLSAGAYFVEKLKDPLLAWAYNYLKSENSFMDVLYETENVPQESPYGMNPVRLFKNTGITVFKSGWEPDDFLFIMQTGSFYNHQHFHQGNVFIADHGSTFTDRRRGSHYWYYSLDPLYLPWYIQPCGYSTILIDHNNMSQRTGDPLGMADGFDDRAVIYHFLDGDNASFVSGDIGRLYWGKVNSLRRNVLYLKPRTVLMLDTVEPAKHDVDVTLLYQAVYLDDIEAGTGISKIRKDTATMNIVHLNPEHVVTSAQEVPHYIWTVTNRYGDVNRLKREGMLTLTASTDHAPLVIANLLTSTIEGEPDVVTERHEGCVCGTVNNIPYVFSTNPGFPYTYRELTTDALALTHTDTMIFAALCTKLEKKGKTVITSENPITCEIKQRTVRYCLADESEVSIGVESKPGRITLSRTQTGEEREIREIRYTTETNTVTLTLPAGEGTIRIQ